jgi:hypothetical protein
MAGNPQHQAKKATHTNPGRLDPALAGLLVESLAHKPVVVEVTINL